MQKAWFGCWRGCKVGVVGPFHLLKGRDMMWDFFWGGALPVSLKVPAQDENLVWEHLG